MVKLTKDETQAIAQVVMELNAKEEKRTKKERKDYRLRNTELLLKNYRKLKIHCEGIIEDLEVYEAATYDPTDLDLHTLMKYKTRTAKMLDYFDIIFIAYADLSKRHGKAAERRHKIVSRLFVDNEVASANELAEYFNIDRSTVTRDIAKAIEELSIMLFGIDSFDDLE